MPGLVLMNGAPASGKSTLAHLLACDSDLTLVLDIDTIRGLLARWENDPTSSGHAARSLALSMCRTHLISGKNVVVPQFLEKDELIIELANTAADVGARFIEVCLVNSAQRATEMFAARESSNDPNHRAAKWLQSDPGATSVSGLYERMIGMVSARSQTKLVESIPGDPKQSLTNLRAAISQAG